MVSSRGTHRIERVTVTLVPSADVRTLPSVPSTFSAAERLYQWRRSADMSYMIVPKKISSSEIQVDLFVNTAKKGKAQVKQVQKSIQEFVRGKIEKDWHGLRLGAISRPTLAVPPRKIIVRGTIEEILGSHLDE